MMLKYKIIVGSLLIVGVFFGGYYTGKGQQEVQVIEKMVKGETEVKIVEREVVKIRTVKPDGTVVEEERITDKQKDTKEKQTVSDKDSSSRPVLSDYRLGAGYWANYRLNEQGWGLTAGRRIVGEVWADTVIRTDSIMLGVSIQL